MNFKKVEATFKTFKHLKTVLKHKYWVGIYCAKAGIPFKGLVHDLSKFSPIEFFESVKYYQGTSSPIDACKKENGWSKAWQHHKGCNSHHYEYFIDDLDNGGKALQMPFPNACELIADYLGAGRVYMGKNFSYEAEYKWWLEKSSHNLLIHPQTKQFIDLVLWNLTYSSDKEILNKKTLLKIYKQALFMVKSNQSSS